MFQFKNFIKLYQIGKNIKADPIHQQSHKLGLIERRKEGKRTAIINHLLKFTSVVSYLEIGVRNPQDNFNHIQCENKYSVDPGLENKDNPVDFPFTSDEFFQQLFKGELSLPATLKFDLIFIDGLHLAEQVDRDIHNSLRCISDKGFVVLHDCNPPDVYYAREDYSYSNGPSGSFWNGTTWKAFYKARHLNDVYSCCVDCDWGVGILTKRNDMSLFNRLDQIDNSFFEFQKFEDNRKKHLNLVTYQELLHSKI